jgi:Transposase
MAEGLVGGAGFAVDASMIKVDANHRRSVPGADGLPPDVASHAVREYLTVLDDAVFSGTTPVVPKFILMTTHKTDRNDARGLAHLARTGFFKPVHVKSMTAHAVRSLIVARKKLVGQRVTMDNQIHGLAVVFGVRLPRALTVAFFEQAVQTSDGIGGLLAAMRGLVAARKAVLRAVVTIVGDIKRLVPLTPVEN